MTALFMVAAGCGDDTTATGGGGNGGEPAAGGGGAAQGGSPAQGGAGGAGGAGGGPDAYACADTLDVESRGSAIALSDDDSVLVVTNRDAGSVSVFSVTYPGGEASLEKTAEVPTGAGSEPWSVVVDGCNSRAWVALRNEDKVVVVDNLSNGPEIVAEIDVGAEPTGVALSPDNTRLYVANWVEGTVTVIDTSDNSVDSTVDLNAELVDTGYLGTVAPRPALAHPRAIAADGTRIVVTEWFGQRDIPDGANGVDADVSKNGVLYSIDADTLSATTIDLPPVLDTGFRDHLNAATGCFVNQVGSVTLKDGFAYVTSTCASPEGPLGVFQRGACTATANCSGFGVASVCSSGACTQACTTDADCGFGSPAGTCNIAAGGTCAPIATNVKTTTHPALSIVDLADDSATTTALDAQFDAPAVDSARMPHLPTDLAFFGDFAYLTAMGTDAVFRLEIDGATIVSVGSATNDFINLRVDASDTTIKNPIGIATVDGADAFAFVANDGSRDVSALSLAAQSIIGTPTSSAVLPTGEELRVLKGKRFFNTGLGRWSLAGEGWGSCAACHIDGLTDNVTWYFARGPRQSTSLDGSYATDDPTDRRVYNWSAIFDETADFELNTRGVSGGVGAIVSSSTAPISNAQRINIAAETPPQQGLSGSTADVANPASPNGEAPFGTSAHPHSVLDDWEEIDLYLQTIRSPRRPVGLVAADVAAGETIFSSASQGNCVACHSGAKWTISKVFWTVGDTGNAELLNAEWLTETSAAAFPASLLPLAAPDANSARMRAGNAANDQILCLIRNVGTFPAAGTVGVGPAAVGIAELRADMTTLAQGGAATSRGFNVPSLLGVQVGAPYFHAGNARSLEEVFDETFFAGHHRSGVAQVFDPTEEQKRQLVAYLLSLDEAEPTLDIPALTSAGGDFCAPN